MLVKKIFWPVFPENSTRNISLANGCDNVYYHIGVARSKSVEGPYVRYGEDILHVDEQK